MSKITVPQELQDQIVDLYVNKGYGRMKIKKELNLSFGDCVIKRVLQENNIHIRNYNEAKVGRYEQEVDQELQNKIVEVYNQGTSPTRIIKMLSLPFSEDKVKTILIKNGIKTRNVQEASKTREIVELRKNKLNDDYVLESHNGAWLMGFIAADGYLPITKGARNRIVISLAEKDKDVLELISKELEYTGEIHHYTSSEGFPYVSLAFASRKIRTQLENYGIGNNKTFRLSDLPNLPKEYMIDFIRGFFDGDGCVCEPKDKKIATSIICASKKFLEQIRNFLHNEYGLTKVIVNEQIRVHPIYDIRYGKQDSTKLCSLFYNNDYIALPRKKNHFLELQEKYSLR